MTQIDLKFNLPLLSDFEPLSAEGEWMQIKY